VHGEHS